jgi:hypothetical protein
LEDENFKTYVRLDNDWETLTNEASEGNKMRSFKSAHQSGFCLKTALDSYLFYFIRGPIFPGEVQEFIVTL